MGHYLISYLISLLFVNNLLKYGSMGVLGLMTLIIFSCKKEDPNANIPVIKNLQIFPDTVTEFVDSVIITFDYVDNNGDLGFQDPNTPSVSVKDSRLQNPDWYHVQPLAPMGSEIPIQGTLRIKLNNLFVIGNAPSETLNFKVIIKDREENQSNELLSKDVTVLRP